MVNQISAPSPVPLVLQPEEELLLGFLKIKLQKAPALCPGGRGGSLVPQGGMWQRLAHQPSPHMRSELGSRIR